MLRKNIDEKTIAKRLIINSLKIEESLVDILKTEVRILNRKVNGDIEYSELQKVNRTLKYVIYVVTILDDRIQKGLDILNDKTKTNSDS